MPRVGGKFPRSVVPVRQEGGIRRRSYWPRDAPPRHREEAIFAAIVFGGGIWKYRELRIALFDKSTMTSDTEAVDTCARTWARRL